MKKILITTLLLTLFPAASAFADDFWAIYAETFAYKHAISGGYVPARPFPGRVSEGDTRKIALRTFGIAFGTRFSQIAEARKKEIIQTCLFDARPYRCAFNKVMTPTVDETRLMPQIRFSDRMLKKAWKLYDNSLRENETIDERMERARTVPPWKKFNPRVSLKFDKPDLIVALPFYTWFSVYVEPRWGIRNGAHLALVKSAMSADISSDGVELQFRLIKNPVGRGYYSVHLTDDSITLDTFLLIY